jgi:hypothetical protein
MGIKRAKADFFDSNFFQLKNFKYSFSKLFAVKYDSYYEKENVNSVKYDSPVKFHG